MSEPELRKDSPAELELEFNRQAIIADRFVPIALLGLGPRGLTVRARDRVTEREVALKLLRTGDGVVASRQGPLPVTQSPMLAIMATGETGSYSFVAQELVESGSLGSRLDGHPWAANEVFALTLALASALAQFHLRGETHGNLKPQNVFLDNGEVRLSDALSVLEATRHGSSLEAAFARLGRYVAPEVARLQSPTPQADVFSLAVIAVELATGRHPFASGDLQSFSTRLSGGAPSLPANAATTWSTALTAALDPRPRQRPHDASEFLAMLGGKSRPSPGRRRAVAIAVGLAALVIGVAMTLSRSRPRTPETTSPAMTMAAEFAGRGDLEGEIDLWELAIKGGGGIEAVGRARVERILVTADLANQTGIARRAAALVSVWRGLEPDFRSRYARWLVPAPAPTSTTPSDHSPAIVPSSPDVSALDTRRNQIRRDANLALSTGNDALALERLREVRTLDANDPTLDWRIHELEQRQATLPLAARAAAIGEVDAVVAARQAASRSDFLAAAAGIEGALASGVEISPEFAGNVLFNASLLLTRLGRCSEAKRYAALAGRYDDPERPMSNRRWVAQLAETDSCDDRRFQVLAESLALK